MAIVYKIESVNHCVNTQELLTQSQEPVKQYQL